MMMEQKGALLLAPTSLRGWMREKGREWFIEVIIEKSIKKRSVIIRTNSK